MDKTLNSYNTLQNLPTLIPALSRPTNFEWLFSSEIVTKRDVVNFPIENSELTWIQFDDIENEIIEDTWSINKTGKVQLDGNRIVDLRNNIVQRCNNNVIEKYAVKRSQLTGRRRRAPDSQRARFTSVVENVDAIFLKRVDENEGADQKMNPSAKTNSDLASIYFLRALKGSNLTFADVVEKAAVGILKEGINMKEVHKAEWLASKLRSVKHFGENRKVDGYSKESYETIKIRRSTDTHMPSRSVIFNNPVTVEERIEKWRKTKYPDEIGTTVVFLYSRESFWFRLLNRILRNSANITLEQLERIGPFSWLLSEYLQYLQDTEETQDLTVYRGMELTDEQRSEFMPLQARVEGRYIELLSFVSTTKNRALAELYGNTLFIIHLKGGDFGEDMDTPPIPCGADITRLSNFPEEVEFLMWPPAHFRSLKYEYDSQHKKHVIYLELEFME